MVNTRGSRMRDVVKERDVLNQYLESVAREYLRSMPKNHSIGNEFESVSDSEAGLSIAVYNQGGYDITTVPWDLIEQRHSPDFHTYVQTYWRRQDAEYDERSKRKAAEEKEAAEKSQYKYYLYLKNIYESNQETV